MAGVGRNTVRRALAAAPPGSGQIGRHPLLVLVAGYSRAIGAVGLPSRRSPDLLAGRAQPTETMNAFHGTLGLAVVQCRPTDPDARGLVERRAALWNLVPPRAGFVSPQDLHTQLAGWLIRADRPGGSVTSAPTTASRTDSAPCAAVAGPSVTVVPGPGRASGRVQQHREPGGAPDQGADSGAAQSEDQAPSG